MIKGKIRLAFRIELTAESKHIWDKHLWETTYQEYRIQHQFYNANLPLVDSYWELMEHNAFASKIPPIISARIQPNIDQLKGKILSMNTTLGNDCFQFEKYKVDIPYSSLSQQSKHKIGITFISPLLLWIDTGLPEYCISYQVEKENGWNCCSFKHHSQLSILYFEKYE